MKLSFTGLTSAFFLLAALGTANAACLKASAQLPAKAMSDFKADPAASLKDKTSAELTSFARALAGTDAAQTASLLSASKSATEAQKIAIGAGLAQAAGVCENENPADADAIQQALVDANVPIILASFQVSSETPPTAGIGGPTGTPIGGDGSDFGGGDVGGGPGGGLTGGGTGGAGSGGGSNTAGSSGNFNLSSGAAGSGGIDPSGVSSSVSPSSL